jgi:hypothetical protein
VIPKFSVIGTILFGLPLVGAAAFMSYCYFVDDFTKELTTNELHFVSGEIVRTETISHPKTKSPPVRQVWLKGSEHPFRFDENQLGTFLLPGKTIEVGLERDKLSSPRYAAIDDQHFYAPITARVIGGRKLLDLETHNSHQRTVRTWFPFGILAVAACGVFLSTQHAVNQLVRSRRPQLKGNRGEPLKFRLFKP